MRFGLLWKLLALNLAIAALVLGAVWFSIDQHASDYFMTLMKKFDVDAPEVNEMFLAANHESLLYVALIGGVVIFLLCFLLTRRLLAPLREVSSGTERVAQGDYDFRVEVAASDEVGDLAHAFNEMAESLASMERLRRSMMVDVAHELRTPLNNLRGYIEALQDGIVDPDAKVFGTLHSELLRLVRLTEDLLQAAREAATNESPRTESNVVEILEETLGLFRPRLERREIEILEHVEASAVPIFANADQVKQVFTNLLQNCLQFAPRGSWIKIRTVLRKDKVRIVVSNPGAPISEFDLPLIFEPYYRTDKSRNRESGGAGIGLSIVRVLVEAHGGDVGASSDSEVTRVWVDFPRMAA